MSAPRCSASRVMTGLAIAALSSLSALLRAANGEAVVVHVQPALHATSFDGWGTSLCWFANAIGRWPEPQRSQIMDVLFATSGLGLTVVRYNIGGGEPADHHHMPWFRQMEGFEPKPGVWNWDADAGQRWVLEAARQRGANRLEAFSNAPPYWMTVSQCASGGVNPNTDNLDPAHAAAFVDYLVTVVQHFHTEWNVSFDTLEPFNEPFTDYWHVNHNQEGCHFDRSSQARLIQQLRAALNQHGLGRVVISAADETNIDRAIGTWESYDAATRACVGQINTHAYATEGRQTLRQLADAAGKPLVMSEVDGGGHAAHHHADMVPALALAGQIMDDLRELQPLRWVFWQAVEDESGQVASNQNWGLIHADLKGESHTWALTKKYYALAQFSRFIRPGAVLASCDSNETIAAFDSRAKILVLVTQHREPDDRLISYDVSAFGEGRPRVRAYRTSASEDVAGVPAEISADGRLTGVARGKSITTYVISW